MDDENVTIEWPEKLFQVVFTMTSRIKRGESKNVECPDCHNQMTISKSDYNGHLSVTCTKCGVKLIQ